MTTGIISGTFDPFTLGHLDLVERASKMFDCVEILICDNSEKNEMFSVEMRKKAIEACPLPKNVRVGILQGLLAEHCSNFVNPVIVRGARNASDFEYEAQMYAMNREIGGVDTIVLPCDGRLSHISSTFAREMIRYNHSLEGIVPKEMIPFLVKEKNEDH